MANIIDTKIQLNWEIDKDELYWEQRARVKWLRNGKKNTFFFHKTVTQRRSKNTIKLLETGDERLTSDQNRMAQIAKLYFKDLFTSRQGLNDMSYILSGIDGCIFEEKNLELTAAFLGRRSMRL